MKATLLNKTAENYDSNDYLINSINDALRYEKFFTENEANNIVNIFDLMQGLIDNISLLSEEIKDVEIPNKIIQKTYQLDSLLDVVRKSINYDSICNAETAFFYMEKYKKTMSISVSESEINNNLKK